MLQKLHPFRIVIPCFKRQLIEDMTFKFNAVAGWVRAAAVASTR